MNIKDYTVSFLYKHSVYFRYQYDNIADKVLFTQKYNQNNSLTNPDNDVIILFNNKIALNSTNMHGGLTDRLKGIISVYKACKETNRVFKILHTIPYNLEHYLCPNKVDWIIDAENISYNNKNTVGHILRYTKIKGEEQYHYARLKRILNRNPNKCIHIYTNVEMVTINEFGYLFNELFKPSKQLALSIDNNLQKIGKEYISLSFRFTHLLGDPVDTYMPELKEKDKYELLSRCLYAIEEIHKKHIDNRLLINSDSTTFLDFVNGKNLDYIYINPGIPVHIDQAANASEESYMKTFIDFFMISKAEKIFLIKSKEMYNSQYPKYAAAITGKDYEIVHI